MLTKDIFNLFVACVDQLENNTSSKSISARSEQNAPLLYPNRVFKYFVKHLGGGRGGRVKLKIKSTYIAIVFFTEYLPFQRTLYRVCTWPESPMQIILCQEFTCL